MSFASVNARPIISCATRHHDPVSRKLRLNLIYLYAVFARRCTCYLAWVIVGLLRVGNNHKTVLVSERGDQGHAFPLSVPRDFRIGLARERLTPRIMQH